MTVSRLNQISTKKGDKGQSKNYNNESFDKDDILFETLGTLDELNSYLGLTYHFSKLNYLKIIQFDLQSISSIIATNPSSKLYTQLRQIKGEDIVLIEDKIQILLDKKPLDNHFYLPGSEKSITGAYYDVCRALTRRAERRIVEFSKSKTRRDLNLVKQYINRLSDLLFLLSLED